MSKISVIIPVYNIETYVEECISSVQEQSYQNIQIIIVDDGSTDCTFHFCQAMAEKDNRIELFQITHGGAAAARNTGLKYADGEFIFWVDGDDTIHPLALETLLELLKQTHADIAKIELTESIGHDEFTVVYEKDTYIRKVLTDEIKSYMAGTLFKKELFDGIWFPEGLMVEDYAIYPSVVNRAEIIASTNRNLYFYRRHRNGSETTIGRNRICGLWPRTIYTMKRYKEYKDKYPDECMVLFAQSISYANITYMKMLDDSNYDSERSMIRNYLKENIDSISQSPYLSHYKKKVAVYIIKHSLLIHVLRFIHELKGKMPITINRRKL